MQYLLYVLIIPFLYFNYKIIISDLKYKKIPNKYLGYLLLLIPFYYIYIFLNFPEINYLLFIGQIIFTFIISFILYYFGIWAAGDAKYLLVLSLFIPYIGVVPFIGNIALVTIFYLLGYFIWFYLGKIIFNKSYRQSLWQNIKQDLSEKWKIYKGNKGGNTYKIISKFLLIFFIIFVSIRLSRIYLFNSILKKGNSFSLFQDFIQKYNIYLIFLLIGIFIGGLYLFRLGINKFKNFISKKLKLDLILVGNILVGILFILLSSFITFELFTNYNEINKLLFKIFTIYLIIYLLAKILIFSYKITFGIAEYQYINIKNLKEGDLVDKEYLIKIFGKQLILGFAETKKEKEQRKKYLLFPSPKNYFQNINNPIDKENLNIIKKCYFITNKFHLKYTTNFQKNNTIKILNTFSFAPYIISGFLLTFLFQDKIFKNILNFGIEIVKNIFHYN